MKKSNNNKDINGSSSSTSAGIETNLVALETHFEYMKKDIQDAEEDIETTNIKLDTVISKLDVLSTNVNNMNVTINEIKTKTDSGIYINLKNNKFVVGFAGIILFSILDIPITNEIFKFIIGLF